MGDFFYRLIRMPGGCRGFVLEDPDGNYNVYINECLSDEQKRITARHELDHIRHGDLHKEDPAHIIESQERERKSQFLASK